METKHTPGPWEIDKDYPKRIQIKDTPDNMPQTGAIADVATGYWKEDVIQANAHLIAAAPDLLEELKKANTLITNLAKKVKHYGYGDEIPNLRKQERQAVIAKAEG